MHPIPRNRTVWRYYIAAVAQDVDRGFRRSYDMAVIEIVGLPRLIEALSAASPVGERLTPAGNRDRRAGREKSWQETLNWISRSCPRSDADEAMQVVSEAAFGRMGSLWQATGKWRRFRRDHGNVGIPSYGTGEEIFRFPRSRSVYPFGGVRGTRGSPKAQRHRHRVVTRERKTSRSRRASGDLVQYVQVACDALGTDRVDVVPLRRAPVVLLSRSVPGGKTSPCVRPGSALPLPAGIVPGISRHHPPSADVRGIVFPKNPAERFWPSNLPSLNPASARSRNASPTWRGSRTPVTIVRRGPPCPCRGRACAPGRHPVAPGHRQPYHRGARSPGGRWIRGDHRYCRRVGRTPCKRFAPGSADRTVAEHPRPRLPGGRPTGVAQTPWPPDRLRAIFPLVVEYLRL